MAKFRLMGWVVLSAALVLGVAHSALATVSNDADTITISVDPILSISDEVGNFTIKFTNATGSAAGSISEGQTVGYLVQANTMPNTALAGALSAKIGTAFTNIELRAVGGSYVNNGTVSNAVLASAGDPIVVGTTGVALANKPVSSGTPSKILNGRFFVNWNAKALADLATGDGGSATLTVTLKDA